jgi:hypothetical protein
MREKTIKSCLFKDLKSSLCGLDYHAI